MQQRLARANARARVAGDSPLEQLPAEILQRIFNFLHIFDELAQPYLIKVNSLSKCLLPYSSSAIYQNVKICNHLNLGRLASGGKRGELINSLVLIGTDDEEGVTGPYAELLERNVECLLTHQVDLKNQTNIE